MRRSALVLAVLVAVWWFSRPWLGSRAAAGEEPLAQIAAAPVAQPEGTPQSPSTSQAPPPATPAAMTVGAEDAVCVAVRQRESVALASGYRKLLDASGSARSALADALSAAAGESSATMLEALGSGNAFVHSEAGRAAGRRLVKVALTEEGEAGLRTFTGLIERAMRGSIDRSDEAARAFVDEVYAAMQSPLNRVVFNPEFTAGARTHQVGRGDTLEKIAATYRKQGVKLDPLTIGLFNRIADPTKLRQGQVLKIPMQPIVSVLEKRSYLLAMYVGDLVFRLYWVGHGKDDRTPETSFTVGQKQEKPDWYFDGRVIPYGHPDNILGAYFVKFEHPSFPGYGAHGTPEPETIGTMASRGCIRMRDADIREFFHIVPRGSQVQIRSTQSPGAR